MLEAGCKKKYWKFSYDGHIESFEWIANGDLLQRGICISKNYRKYIAPEQGKTKVHTTIEYQTVRNVDAKDQTLSFDLVLTLAWLDQNIRTNFSNNIDRTDGIVLSPGAVDMIWTPDLFIWNRTAVTSTNMWASLIQTKILSSNTINDIENESGVKKSPLKATVEMKYVIKTTIYCQFQYFKYPMDSQNCSVKIGSSSHGAIFTLLDHNHSRHKTQTYNSAGLNIDVIYFGYGNSKREDAVGFHVQMTRLTKPYLMMYYIPCVAIVLVSELAFIVPLTADGISSLLVTNLLTLVSLFIYQMVN